MILNRTGTAWQMEIRLLFYKKEWTMEVCTFCLEPLCGPGRKEAHCRLGHPFSGWTF
ncbi:hypothetical protein SAMN05444162_0062 [Paenibacillaceae bacterium GAS479]|nr:hypothetical protein SAMN05444162_0062 [Paenibacillaceae bacterium GAS479]